MSWHSNFKLADSVFVIQIVKSLTRQLMLEGSCLEIWYAVFVSTLTMIPLSTVECFQNGPGIHTEAMLDTSNLK